MEFVADSSSLKFSWISHEADATQTSEQKNCDNKISDEGNRLVVEMVTRENSLNQN